jgi:hypothetical protein
VRAYDLLELLCDHAIEDADGYSTVDTDDARARQQFCDEYDSLAPALEKTYDEAALQALLARHLQPYKAAVDKAASKVAELTDLHECAKSTFDIWQNKGLFARQRAIRILRQKAGFRLETKRIGNYVAKTFDLMNEAQMRFAKAQQAVFAADVTYKIQPGIYFRIYEELKKENGGLGVDLCFEASGAPTAVAQGFDILRNRGVYLVPGQYSNSGGVEIQPQLITFKALHIIGSSQYSVSDVRAYHDFLCAHKEIHETIVKLGSRYKIEDVNLAFEDAKAGNNVKTLLVK